MSMIRDYITNEEHYVRKFGENTMFLMQCGSFYEVYCCKKNGEFLNGRIQECSRICDVRIANKQSKYKGLQVFMCGFPELQLEKYVKKLNDAGWTVAVHSQDPTCPKIRKEAGVYSPGTNFDVISTGSNRIMTIWIELYDTTKLNKSPKVSCGIATVDIISGDVHTFQCVENYFNTPTTFDELERFNSSYKPNEVVIIHNCTEKQVNDIINYADINSSLVHKIDLNSANEWTTAIKNCQKQTYHEEQLIKYYDINDYDVFYDTHLLREREYATQALVFLMNFLDFHDRNLVRELKEPIYTNIEERVRLANHSLRQLNIIDNNKKSKFSSLMSLVNKSKTPMGKRYLSDRLLNPTNNINYLTKEYEIIEHVLNSSFDWEITFKNLEKVTDFERLFRKIILNKVAPSDLAILYDNLKVIGSTYDNLSENNTIFKYLYFKDLTDKIKDLKKKIGNTIDIKKAGGIAGRDFDINIFKHGIYSKLDNAEFNYLDSMERLQVVRTFLINKLDEKNSKTKETIRVHQTEKSGLFLVMTKTRFKKLKKILEQENIGETIINYSVNDVNMDIIIDFGADPIKEGSAGGNNVRLDSSVLNSLYTKISQTKSNLKEILMSIYRDFIDSFLEYKKHFETIIKFVIKLDFLLTRVFVAKNYNYCKPVIDDTPKQSFINAKSIRHPLIEHIQDNEIYVPNDISLGVGGEHTGIMLFGTNAVGKSSLIRSIGMSVVLAQAGFYVPCSEFIYKPYNSIFTRILGNDDIFKGLSTFAVEMSELSCILKNADENSLILGDELCSGTETTSALCIFSAGVMMLHDNNSSFIFATHFHELVENKEIANLKRLSLQHMVVRYDEKLKALVYDRKIRAGSGNKLYGLEVCKSLSMPQEFLMLANKLRCDMPTQNIVLDGEGSKYNSKKIKNICELCGNKATEIHHMQPQKDADELGFINSFHKNHKANLCSICVDCHRKITINNVKHIRVKTEVGMKLIETSNNF